MTNLLSFSSFMAKNWIWFVVIGGIILVVAVIALILLTRKPKAEEVKEENATYSEEEIKEEAEKEEAEEVKTEEPKKRGRPKKAVEEKVEEPQEKIETEEVKIEEKPKTTSKKKVAVKAEAKTEEVKEEKKKAEKYSVVYSKDEKMWIVKKSGTNRANRKFKLKADALAYAEKVAEKNETTISVKGMTGKFQKVKTKKEN